MELSAKQLTRWYNQGIVPDGLKGWEMEINHDAGSFDSEKGALYDYEIELINPDVEGEDLTGCGGYYTGVTGDCFNHDIEFV